MKGFLASFLLLTACAVQADTKVVCFGDSVTLGRGMPQGASWCDQLDALPRVRTINLGVGGDTSRDGLARFPEILKHKPDAVIIMFGLNDAYNGGEEGVRVSLEEYESNIDWMIKKLKKKKIQVVLQTSNCTLSINDNFKLKPYVEAARRLARNHKIPLVENYSPFAEAAMEGLEYYIDAVHPSEAGHYDISKRVNKIFKKRRG